MTNANTFCPKERRDCNYIFGLKPLKNNSKQISRQKIYRLIKIISRIILFLKIKF